MADYKPSSVTAATEYIKTAKGYLDKAKEYLEYAKQSSSTDNFYTEQGNTFPTNIEGYITNVETIKTNCERLYDNVISLNEQYKAEQEAAAAAGINNTSADGSDGSGTLNSTTDAAGNDASVI